MFSSCARLINSKFCIKISYLKRVTGLSIYFFCGYISLFTILFCVESIELNHTLAFCLTLIPSLIMGTGSAFGEASILGYLRLFPEGYVSGWSSGTGLAGVSGATITLICKYQHVSSKWLYLGVSPVCAVYFGAFFLSQKLRIKAEGESIIEEIQHNKVAEENIVGNTTQDKGQDNENNGEHANEIQKGKEYLFII